MMKKIISIYMLCITIGYSFPLESGTIILEEDLVKENGIVFYEGVPFTGRSLSRGTGPMPSSGVAITSWENGIMHGMGTAYHDEDRMQLHIEGFRSYGLQHGRHVMWHSNGKVSSINNYYYGISHGPRTSFYDNGVKSFEGVYVNDKLHGPAMLWDRNGKLVYSFIYHLGEIMYTIKDMDPNFNRDTGLIEEPEVIVIDGDTIPDEGEPTH